MSLVPGDNVAEGANGDEIAIRDAAPGQLVFAQVAKNMDRCRPNCLEFVDEVLDGPLVETSGGGVSVLVKASDRSSVAAGEAQGSICEDALSVGEMTNDFLYGPFGAGVRVPAPRGAA